jgi:hypothetical protein
MRKGIATLAAVAAAFGGTAVPASADVPDATNEMSSEPGVAWGYSCRTPAAYGYLNQYGAWGYYVDGCTTPALRCPVRRCRVTTSTTFDTVPHNGHRVTQNARVRVFDPNGVLRRWQDKSCAGTNACSTADVTALASNDLVTVQCNGVREASAVIPISRSTNFCSYRISFVG